MTDDRPRDGDRQATPPPSPRAPLPVSLAPSLMGERVVVYGHGVAADGTHLDDGRGNYHYGLRAWSEIYMLEGKGWAFDFITEADYWRWRLTGRQPSRVQVASILVAWLD